MEDDLKQMKMEDDLNFKAGSGSRLCLKFVSTNHRLQNCLIVLSAHAAAKKAKLS